MTLAEAAVKHGHLATATAARSVLDGGLGQRHHDGSRARSAPLPIEQSKQLSHPKPSYTDNATGIKKTVAPWLSAFSVVNLACLIAGHAKHKTEGVGNTTLSHQSIDNHGPKCRACPGFDPVFEHRLFCHITRAWRSKLLTSHQTAIELIASTTTRTGLTMRHKLGTNTDPKAIKATPGEMGHPQYQGSHIPSGVDRYDLAETAALKR